MRNLFPPAHAPLKTWFLCSAVVCLAGLGPMALAQEDADPSIVAVEEDWELTVKSPDQNSAGPQVTCTISPYANVDFGNATFELNHQSQPQFVAGGIQLQTWADENPIASRKFPRDEVLHHDNEVVTWTQIMQIDDAGVVTFEIVNGASQSWGSFGGQGYLKSSLSTNLSDLNAYHPSNSAANSGVSYGANLVTSLTLKRARIQWSDGTSSEYSNAITVCSNQ